MSKKKKDESEDIRIESTMKSIEILLEKLENNDTMLDESMLAFEEGIRLIRSAQKILSSAEQKVQLLLEEDGAPEESEFMLDEKEN